MKKKERECYAMRKGEKERNYGVMGRRELRWRIRNIQEEVNNVDNLEKEQW